MTCILSELMVRSALIVGSARLKGPSESRRKRSFRVVVDLWYVAYVLRNAFLYTTIQYNMIYDAYRFDVRTIRENRFTTSRIGHPSSGEMRSI